MARRLVLQDLRDGSLHQYVKDQGWENSLDFKVVAVEDNSAEERAQRRAERLGAREHREQPKPIDPAQILDDNPDPAEPPKPKGQRSKPVGTTEDDGKSKGQLKDQDPAPKTELPNPMKDMMSGLTGGL